jgi:hypothetical protein
MSRLRQASRSQATLLVQGAIVARAECRRPSQHQSMQKVRRVVIARAQGRCELCGVETDRLSVHHPTKVATLLYHGLDPIGDPDELIATCRSCHARAER